MPLNLSDNYFELFGMQAAFAIDTGALEEKYRKLLVVLHPDRYASAGKEEQRFALQAAAHVNDAYRTLKDNCARADYLLKLGGVSQDNEQNTMSDNEFLMHQMEMREALDESETAQDPTAELTGLAERAASGEHDAFAEFDRLWQGGELEHAQHALNKARFFNKMSAEIKTSMHHHTQENLKEKAKEPLAR